ncbi:MAG: NADH:ubiquinone oxidoreductase subunit NDUFA12 [Alphaproteobacteria bacterium]|nr:NADH:ubiquinone oxidoreductase subunit NDUFA12 [Alphaproteobacteria bacterium]
MQEPYSWIARFSHLGTQLFTMFSGELVGTDSHGNRYFRQRKKNMGKKGATLKDNTIREKRWVMYNGRPEASLVPPEWHGWLHYTLDEPLPEESDFHQAWVKQHHANLTFSDKAYRPPGHFLEGGKRDKATGDYQAWQPNK